jgi:hypothetical protein
MRKESHLLGAYQDFVRNAGAPNILLIYNAQTQIGLKWTTTSRNKATEQVNTVPHNQQQNQSERKIRDVKKRTILTLRQWNAPLVLCWCFCLIFIVDCLNHTSAKALEWRTPKEKQDSHRPDISSFRFKF